MLKRVVNINILVWFIVLSFSFLVGCAKPPTQEIESADKAVAEAKQKEADLYVQDGFSKAEEALKKAKSYVEEKKYKEAKLLAEEALGLAQQTIAMIEPNKAQMKADTEQIILEVQNSLGELKSSVVQAIRKKAEINREEIQGTVGKLEIDIVSAKEQLQAGKIRQAHDELVSVKDQIKAQEEGLNATMEAKADKI